MSRWKELAAAIPEVDADASRACQLLLDEKTKPRGSLGRLEELACRLAAIRGEPAPRLGRKAVVVMAADHGVAAEGVSAYPQAVTAQMVVNFLRGGAAINVLARRSGTEVIVVDLGVAGDLAGADGLHSRPVNRGTRSITQGPAMSLEEVERALNAGAQIAEKLIDDGIGMIGLGEMGIGNTTAASALTASYLRKAPAQVTGAGTGVDGPGFDRKLAAVERALQVNERNVDDPLQTLAALGGFEIAGLAGAALAAAARRVPVVIDGFISTAGALAATRLAPAIGDYLFASHRSTEPGHRLQLEALRLRPLLELELRLGEGTGTVPAMDLIEASLAIVHEMATFAEAAVSKRESPL